MPGRAKLVRVLIRDRTADDAPALEAIALQTHAQDGYPKYLPADPISFVMDPEAIGGWVAEEGGVVLGHVALHPRSAPAVMDLAHAATGLEDGQLVVLARLLVAPVGRRRGIGKALIEHAVAEAERIGRHAVLDVVKDHRAAIALYESSGWTLVGEVEWTLQDGRPLDEYVYIHSANLDGQNTSATRGAGSAS